MADRVLESLRHRWSSQTQREAGPPVVSALARSWLPWEGSKRGPDQVEGRKVAAAAVPPAPDGANGFRPPRNHYLPCAGHQEPRVCPATRLTQPRGTQVVNVHGWPTTSSQIGASRRGTEAGEPPLELETGGFQHRPVGDKPERRARHGLSPVLRLRHDSCTGIGRLIGSVNDQDLEDAITGQQQIHSGECPDRPSPIWGAPWGRSDPCLSVPTAVLGGECGWRPQPLPDSFTTAAAAASGNALWSPRPLFVPVRQCPGTASEASGERPLGMTLADSCDLGSLGDGKLEYQRSVVPLNLTHRHPLLRNSWVPVPAHRVLYAPVGPKQRKQKIRLSVWGAAVAPGGPLRSTSFPLPLVLRIEHRPLPAPVSEDVQVLRPDLVAKDPALLGKSPIH